MKGTILAAIMMASLLYIGCSADMETEDGDGSNGVTDKFLFNAVPTITLQTEEREVDGELVEKTMAIYVFLVASKPAAEEIKVKFQSTSHLWNGKKEEPNTFIKRVAKGEVVSKNPFGLPFTTRESGNRIKEMHLEILESEDGKYKAGPPIKIQF